MSQNPTPRRRSASRRRRSQTLLDNGMGAMAGGLMLWLVSIAMHIKEDLRMAARALLAPSWMAIAIGVGMILLYVWRKWRTRVEANMLLRQHSTFLEPMPKLKTKPKRHRSGHQARPSAHGNSVLERP